MRVYAGLVWRHLPVGKEPLHLGWILKGARGRWNTRRPRLPCLYTSLTPQGAIAEFEKHVAEYAAPRRRDLVSLYASVGPVLNLTSAPTRQRVGIRLETILGDGPRDTATCRAIARRYVLEGSYRAILAPSASLEGAVNLMIYVASTPGIQELANGPDRMTITPGLPLARPHAATPPGSPATISICSGAGRSFSRSRPRPSPQSIRGCP